MRRDAWHPVLDGATAKLALATVEAVAAAIRRRLTGPSSGPVPRPRRKTKQPPSLAGGSAGLAVFYDYLHRSESGRSHGRLALRLLEQAGDDVASVTMDPSLYGGFTGVAWAIVHLRGERFDRDDDDPTQEVDAALMEHLQGPGWLGQYDLVSGLVGFGVYALERLPSPAAVACLSRIVDRLDDIAQKKPDGFTWPTPPGLLPPWQRERCPRGYYNIGLAHGVPGVIALLGAACATGVNPRKARKLLDGGVAWLLRRKRKSRTGSHFPAWVARGVSEDDCRSAWCYGDPGVAAALLCAARSVNEPAWEREAVKIARRSATCPPEEAGVVDAGLCHGAAGLGHVFNRMYQTTGDATLRHAARYWFERTLAMRQPGRGVGGYSAVALEEDGTRYLNADPGILMGAAGIALALLGAATPIEPAWDRMLLVSVPAQR